MENNLNNIYPLFLELLKSAIWQQPANKDLFIHVDEQTWKSLVHYAGIQRANALIGDGLSTLPVECNPPRNIAIALLLQTEKTEEANKLINETLSEISEEYTKQGFVFALLKGQGNALYYPKPLHRTPGDIDLFLYRPGDYEKATQWVIEKGYPRSPENMHHLEYTLGNVHIENHYHATYFTNNKYNKPFARQIKNITETHSWETVKVNDINIQVFPATFNAFYIFEHLFHHFIHTGIGFRQLCDWALFLQARHQYINKEEFTQLARQFGLLKAMQAFAHVIINYLGASPAIFPFDIGESNRFAKPIIDDILKGGHFGYYRSDNFFPKSKWLGRWNRYKKSIQRSFIFGSIAPSHIRTLPLNKLLVRIKLTRKGG